MDKIEKIRRKVEALLNDWKYRSSTEAKYRSEVYMELLEDIDSGQEEPVSDDLEDAAHKYADLRMANYETAFYAFMSGADWQKEQMMKDAVGGTIVFAHFGNNNKECGFVAHDYFCLESRGLKDRQKVKVIILKGE